MTTRDARRSPRTDGERAPRRTRGNRTVTGPGSEWRAGFRPLARKGPDDLTQCTDRRPHKLTRGTPLSNGTVRPITAVSRVPPTYALSSPVSARGPARPPLSPEHMGGSILPRPWRLPWCQTKPAHGPHGNNEGRPDHADDEVETTVCCLPRTGSVVVSGPRSEGRAPRDKAGGGRSPKGACVRLRGREPRSRDGPWWKGCGERAAAHWLEKVRILGVSECEDSESVRNPSESQLFVTTMNQDVRHADSPARRSSKECANAPKVSFVETLVKDDIDAAVEGMLCKENYIIKKLDKYLQHQDFLNARRKEMLHKRWVENVDCPLQQKIIDKFSSPREMEKKKRLEPDGYWRFRNTTGWKHRQFPNISRSENSFLLEACSPLTSVDFCKKSLQCRHDSVNVTQVTLPPFRDPLLQAQQDRDEENRAILQCETGKIYTMKEFKEVKAKWLGTLPPFSFGWQDRRPNSGLVGEENCQKSSARAKLGSAGRIRLPSRKYSPVLKRRSEGAREKVVDLVLGISGLTLAAWSTVDQDKAGSYKAAEAWAHRPAPLRSATRPASQKLHCMYLEKPAHPCTGPGPSHNMRRSAWVPSALS
uniref:Uncharacterized protein LOC110202029 n=1 Tax=Phascolarctos cinereus TaxID=38626 RepID=A0A6P5JQW0_PHACI|nr:uncharacterized protein LOC110202029 [Phascolarctos cinereus]